MAQNDNKDIIDLRKLIKQVLSRKKLFFKVWGITFVVASLLILCVPRYYTTSAKLAPEMGGTDIAGGTLGSIASSFGFDLGDMQTTDAINPLLYPDLMDDNAFVTRLFKVQVKTIDGAIDTDYYTYLHAYQKSPWWTEVRGWVMGLFKSSSDDRTSTGESEFNPYFLSSADDQVAGAIRNNIKLAVDKKNGVITISSTAQDPLVCKTLADTIQVYLQEYITNYRTKKARIDVDHYEQLCNEALDEYNQARQAYAAFADANRNVISQSVSTRISDLENLMQLKYNNYTAYNVQLQAAYAKVQERTPAFTILKGADVPIKPAGPKRMIFVIGMLFLTTFCTMFWVVRKDLHFKF